MSFNCYLSSGYKTISYPNPVTLEPLFTSKLPPLVLATDHVRPGDILLYRNENKKIISLYKMNFGEIHQIYGSPEIDLEGITVECPFYHKKKQIDAWIQRVFFQINLHDLIHNHNDFRHFEDHIISYLLKCKTTSKIDRKKLRSICFKSFKNSLLAEKVDSLIKVDFDYFDDREGVFKVDFTALRYQKNV